jgi:uncharacterized protein (UPF0332 family)
MSITPVDLLTWANANSTGRGEECLRAAVSRAYYAAYHTCRNWHLKLPLPGSSKSSGGSHDELISQLMHPSTQCTAEQSSISRQLGGALTDLKILRTVADYRLEVTLLPASAQEACQKSALILKKAT